MRSLPVLLLFCVLALSGNAAQDPSSALLLKSGTIYPQSNTNEFINTPVSTNEIIDGYYYRIVQFSEYPDIQLQSEISAAGIILNEYLPYRSYNCAIPAGFDRTKVTALKISSVLKWENAYKLHNKINGQDFPEHTKIVKGHADLVIHYQKNISDERAVELLRISGFNVLSSLPASHTITIRMPFGKLNDLLGLPFVHYVEPIAVPSTKDDVEGKSLHRSNMISNEYTTGRHYDGDGVVIGLADDGAIGPHIDFTGRVTQHMTDLGGDHGDMTSGICVGAGNLSPRHVGMATGAYLHVYDISGYPQIHDAVLNYNNHGIVITSTSYAQSCNEYNADSREGDMLIHSNPQFSFCFSAGNAGTDSCDYGAGFNWGNITGGFKMGKNIIAVGNLDDSDNLENSSSRGPAVDGRIKPEICANGHNQLSTDEYNTYQTGGGTSAACPSVAGCLAQLYQAYKEINNTTTVPSALLKACILNTAEDLGNPGPDFKHGWGRINSYRALRTLEENKNFGDSVSQGQSKTFNITIPANTKQLRAMIYWHDVEGAVSSAKNLVNDLNLVVTRVSNSQDYFPLVLDPTPIPANLNAPAVPGIDSLNNAEQVRIDNPAAGNYTINVEGFQVPLGTQTFYVVYEFLNDSLTVTFPNGGEGLIPGETELIRWDAHGTFATFNLDYSDDGGNNWTNIMTAVAGTERQYSWNIPSTANDEMLLRVSRAGISDESDTMFTVMSLPPNFHVAFVCPDSIGLEWNSVAGSTGYEVSMLGAKYMDYVATTTATNFTFPAPTIITEENWFSVRALGPNGGKGCRADAIAQVPGLLNCSLPIDGDLTLVRPTTEILTDCSNLNSIEVEIHIVNPGISTISNFSVHFRVDNGTVVTETFTNSISTGGGAFYTFSQPLTLTSGNHILSTWITVPGDLNLFNDTSVTSFEVLSGTPGTVGTSEPFTSLTICSQASNCEAGNCILGNGWINGSNNGQDDIDWRVNQGSTPTADTGPTNDHTTGTGKYLYLEASGCDVMEAMLFSPCFDLTNTSNPVLTFWYHMYGADMGELHADIIADDGIHPEFIPARFGNQGNSWKMDSINLSQFIGQTISVRFRGITGNGIRGDMALDDINVEERTTGLSDVFENSFRIFPNPSAGIFRVSSNLNRAYEIQIVDAVGKTQMVETITGNGQIDLSGLPSGVYTAVIQYDEYSHKVKLMNIRD